MKRCLFCPECACTADDPEMKLCEHCRPERPNRCPICRKPIREERAIFRKDCGTKLQISCLPIQ